MGCTAGTGPIDDHYYYYIFYPKIDDLTRFLHRHLFLGVDIYIYIYPNIQIHLFTYIANNILSTYTTIRIHNNVMFFLNLNIVYEGSVYLNNFLVRSIPQKVEGTP